nr:hypothetical protein Iba_chr11eCG10970 [Ipomoea batatas]
MKMCGSIFLGGSEYAVVVEFRGDLRRSIIESSGFGWDRQVLKRSGQRGGKKFPQSQHGLEGKTVGARFEEKYSVLDDLNGMDIEVGLPEGPK